MYKVNTKGNLSSIRKLVILSKTESYTQKLCSYSSSCSVCYTWNRLYELVTYIDDVEISNFNNKVSHTISMLGGLEQLIQLHSIHAWSYSDAQLLYFAIIIMCFMHMYHILVLYPYMHSGYAKYYSITGNSYFTITMYSYLDYAHMLQPHQYLNKEYLMKIKVKWYVFTPQIVYPMGMGSETSIHPCLDLDLKN